MTDWRFWERVKKTDGCWEWQGPRYRNGYGCVSVSGRKSRAHRVAYEITHGSIPAGMQVCHRCDNPGCVRPDHLFLGTFLDNMQDMWRKGRGRNTRLENAKASPTCKHGHAWTEDNTSYYMKNGLRCRACLACHRDKQRRYLQRREAKSA